MNKIGYILILFILSCAEPTNTSISETNGLEELQGLDFGSDLTFEMLTWNIETFPKKFNLTVQYVAEIIYYVSPDVVAMQEIQSRSYFNSIVDDLNEIDNDHTWIGFRAGDNSTWMELAYIIKSDAFDAINPPYEIYHSSGSEFPREPYVLELTYAGNEITIINNHLKCCGNGIIDYDNYDDEEFRRLRAISMIQEYIAETLSGENVIVTGDMNDELTDTQENNVFWEFIDDPVNYLFTDMDIAEDNTHRQWSFPTWPSHLDHILITSSLLDEFNSPVSEVLTILVDDYIEGEWNAYEANISDHRPVGIKLFFD